jgi:hypothetical protein
MVVFTSLDCPLSEMMGLKVHAIVHISSSRLANQDCKELRCRDVESLRN